MSDRTKALGGTKTAVITGASSGIGAASARVLAHQGFDVIVGARRLDRLQEVADACGGRALALDVTDKKSVTRFADAIERADVLVNNAGGAFGLDRIEDADVGLWRSMYELNVIGVLQMTRALLPKLLAAPAGQIINLGSVASFEVYPGGGGYTAAKHALRALTRTLRLELVATPIRISEVCPGMTETEFALVRFDGDEEKAQSVYRGIEPLVAEDIAACIGFLTSQPAHVNIDEMVIRPRQQANAFLVHRDEP